MALSPKLDFRQSQSLVMTPQLMQSIKLLQMTHMELEQFLDIEIEKNPLLDRIEAANDDFSGAESARDGAETGGEDAASDDFSDRDWFKQALRIMPKTSHPPSTARLKISFRMIRVASTRSVPILPRNGNRPSVTDMFQVAVTTSIRLRPAGFH